MAFDQNQTGFIANWIHLGPTNFHSDQARLPVYVHYNALLRGTFVVGDNLSTILSTMSVSIPLTEPEQRELLNLTNRIEERWRKETFGEQDTTRGG